MEIKPEQYFWLKDGNAIKSIEEFSRSLESMDQEIFNHHVNDQKNDFANWIRDVFNDQELGEIILSANNLIDIKQKVAAFLSNKIEKQEKLEMPALIQYKPAKNKKSKIFKIKKRIKVMHKAIKKDLAKKTLNAEVLHKEVKEEIPSEIKKEVKPVSKVCSTKCHYYSFEGAITEFIVGVAVGIIIAVALSVYL